MSSRLSRGARRVIAVVVLSGTLAAQVFAAISGGHEAGRNCLAANPFPSTGWMDGCCSGQCQTIHTIGSPGYNECKAKCNSHVPAVPVTPIPPILTEEEMS